MPIALTFDDGPSNKTTPKLLDILDRLKIKATFFVVGQNIKPNGSVLQRIASSGQNHEICNHSWSHPNFLTLSPDKVREEIERTQKVIEDTINRSPSMVFRPPYGAINENQKKFIGQTLGFKLAGWTVDPNDWKEQPPAKIADTIYTETKDGDVILAHDIHERTIAAMADVLPRLKNKFQFITISRMSNITERNLGGNMRPSNYRVPR